MKKQIALLLSLTMALTSFGFPVWAEGETAAVTTSDLYLVEDFEDTTYALKDNSRMTTPALQDDTVLGSKVAKLIEELPAQKFVGNMYYDANSPRTGVIKAGMKVWVDDVDTTCVAPVGVRNYLENNLPSMYQLAPTVYISKGKLYEAGNSEPVADVKIAPKTWYDFQVTMNIDGNSSTVDTYDYVVKTIDGNVVASGTGKELDKSISQGQSVMATNEGIQYFTFANVCLVDYSDTSVKPSYILADDIYINYANPVATIDGIENGATDVELLESLTIDFGQYMDTATYAGIKLVANENDAVEFEYSTDATSTTLTLDKALDYDTTYTLTIPASVKAQWGAKCDETVITFTTKAYVDTEFAMKENFEDTTYALKNNGRMQAPALQDDPNGVLTGKVAKLVEELPEQKFVGNMYYDAESLRTGVIKAGMKVWVDNVDTTCVAPVGVRNYLENNLPTMYQLAPTVYISKGKLYEAGNSEPVADVKIAPKTWYDFQVTMNIDGNSSTVDTYDYVVKTIDGNVVASGTGKELDKSISQGQSVMATNEGIQYFTFANVCLVDYSDTSVKPSYILADDIYIDYAEVGISDHTLRGDTIEEGYGEPVKVYEIEFSQYMNVDTYSNITVKKADMYGDMTYVEDTSFTVSGTSRKAVLTFDEYMNENYVYEITVPSSVKAFNGMGIEETVLTVYIYEFADAPTDPSQSLIEDFEDEKADGFSTTYMNANIVVDQIDTSRGMVWELVRNYWNSASAPKATEYISYAEYAVDAPQTGAIKYSTMFKMDDPTNMNFMPISLTGGSSYYQSASFIRIIRGSVYEPDSTEIKGAITADTWYQLDVTLFVDGDSTTKDTFSYTLKTVDGVVVAENSNVVFGDRDHGGSDLKGHYEQTSVQNVAFGLISLFDLGLSDESAITSAPVYLDDIKITKYVSPIVTASITDGDEEVEIDHAITFKFDQEVNAADFDNITLKKKNVTTNADGEIVETFEPVAIRATVLDGYTKTCTIELAEGILDYSSDYVLTVKNVTNKGGIAVVPFVVNFRTVARGTDIVISNEEVSATTFTPGEVITVSADFTNNSQVTGNPAALFIALYNGEDMYAVGYTTTSLDIGGTESISASLTVPQGFNPADAEVRVFAWDSIDGMTPVSVEE